MKRALLPVLEWIRAASPETRTVVGLRDIVDEPPVVQEQWERRGVYKALERLYDHVLIYGEQAVFDPIREYGLSERVARKALFTGYLSRCRLHRTREDARRALGLGNGRLVIVHTGGGGDGYALVRTYLECIKYLPADVHSLVVTGPLMERENLERLQRIAPAQARLVDYQDDLANCLPAADLSISMGGYNTVCEVLAAGVPAIVVPRVYPRTEQAMRAERLAARGLVEMIMPRNLSPRRLL
jgi:predicted glycosyltransferase